MRYVIWAALLTCAACKSSCTADPSSSSAAPSPTQQMVKRGGSILAPPPDAAFEPGFMHTLKVSLHGDTPVMAWSPDGKRLAVNSAYADPLGSEDPRRRDDLGIYVFNLTGTATAGAWQEQHATDVQALHPYWVDENRVAWTSRDPDRDRTGVVLDVGSGQIDSYNVTETVQCPQRAGGLALEVTANKIRVRVGAAKAATVTERRPFMYSHWSCQYETGGCGPVPACLSPTGSHVAFFTHGGNGYDLNVARIDRKPLQAAAQATATQVPSLNEQLIGDTTGDRAKILVNLPLFGDTPTLAWSPDSKRIVTTSAMQFDYEDDNPAGDQGVYVIDVQKRKHWRSHTGTAFHPVWVGGTRLAWSVDGFTGDGTAAGVYVQDMGSTSGARRVLNKSWAHTVTPANGNEVLVYVYDDDPSSGWFRVNTDTGKTEFVETEQTMMDPEPSRSWHPPTAFKHLQCKDRVGDVTVQLRGSVLSVKTGTKTIPVSDAVWQFSHWTCAEETTDGNRPGPCGPVQACLSPDGRHVAFVSTTQTAKTFAVKVAAIVQ